MALAARLENRKRPHANEEPGAFDLEPTYEEYKIDENNSHKFKSFMCANGVVFKDAEKAKQYLLIRDHRKIYNLLDNPYHPGIVGTICLPSAFLTRIPKVIDYESFSQKLENTQNIDELPKDIAKTEYSDVLGDSTEREAFEGVKKYLEKNQADALMLFGHNFLYGDNFREKDCIVVNLTKGYILAMECKISDKRGKFAKAKEQLSDAKYRVQKLINSVAGISDRWKCVTVYYQKDTDFRGKRTDFTIIGISELESKLARIEQNLHKKKWQPEHHQKEFVYLCTELMFVTQANKDAPITGAKNVQQIAEQLEEASSPESIFFWTPEQLSVVNAIKEPFMALHGYFGVGKTLLLKERCKFLLTHHPNEDVYFFLDPNCTALFQALSAEFSSNPKFNIKYLQNIYQGIESSKRKVEYANTNQILVTLSKEGVKPQDHVVVDELFLGNCAMFLRGFEVAKTEGKLRSLWVSIGAIDKDVSKEEIQRLPIKLNALEILCPTLRYSLRNGNNILNFCLHSVPYTDQMYNTFGSDLINHVNLNVNKGVLKKITLPINQFENAVERALEEIPRGQKTIFACDSHGGLFKYTKKCCIKAQILKHSNQKWMYSSNENHLADWFAAKETDESYLVCCTKFYPQDSRKSNLPAVTSSNEYSGIELRQMVYFNRICPECKDTLVCPNLISRAKAYLLVIRLEVLCNKCEEKKQFPRS